jgi:hypothetical protein
MNEKQFSYAMLTQIHFEIGQQLEDQLFSLTPNELQELFLLINPTGFACDGTVCVEEEPVNVLKFALEASRGVVQSEIFEQVESELLKIVRRDK